MSCRATGGVLGFFGWVFLVVVVVFFSRPDINLGFTAPVTVVPHQQHGESEKRN